MIHGNCTRRRFLAGAAAGALPAPSQSSQRPNILFLLADDQRWDALGCMGNRIIRTPVIDRLAAEGVTFYNNFCATAICMTSRASIFTGQLEKTHGVSSFQRELSPEAFSRTYPVLLRKAGYRTGFIGKFGLGGKLPAAEFDYFKGFPGQGKYVQVVDGKTLHLTDVMGDQALEFLEGSSAEQPFCLSISFKGGIRRRGSSTRRASKTSTATARFHCPRPRVRATSTPCRPSCRPPKGTSVGRWRCR